MKQYAYIMTMLTVFFLCAATHQCEEKEVLDRKIAKNPDTLVHQYDTVVHFLTQEIHHVTLTKYNPTVAQCDSDPYNTADGTHIDTLLLKAGAIRWCALSRDLLARWGGPFDYGDTIHIHAPHMSAANGWWVVHDTMSEYTHDQDGNLIVRENWIDILQWFDSSIHGVNRDVLLSNMPI